MNNEDSKKFKENERKIEILWELAEDRVWDYYSIYDWLTDKEGQEYEELINK